MLHVPYKGGGPAMTDLLGGRIEHVPRACRRPSRRTSTPASCARSRPPARSARRRCPTVPTIAESGYPGFEATNWYAFVAPGKTPREILDYWNREIVKALNDPQVKAELAKHGLDPAPGTREELAQYMERELQKWGKVVKDAKITAE